MKKYSLIIIIAFLIVSLPVFAARNMNKDKIADSIRDCSYFQTTTYIPRDTGSIKFKENIKGYVDGKCRYVMEWYYPNANARGLICDMNDEQRNMLYNKKIGSKSKHGLFIIFYISIFSRYNSNKKLHRRKFSYIFCGDFNNK